MVAKGRILKGMLHPICTTPDGIEICVDLINSEAAQNISRQPQLLSLVKEALANKNLTGDEVTFERNLGRTVGYDFIIDTPSDDAVFYAQVYRDNTYTRFIKGGKPVATKYVTVGLKHRAGDGMYELCDARIGRLVPPRPELEGATPKSKQYWASHAFVQDGQILQLRTVTKTCPY